MIGRVPEGYKTLRSKRGEPFCRERRDGWTCTRPEGHDGDHAAHGPDDDTPYASWGDGDLTVWPRQEEAA